MFATDSEAAVVESCASDRYRLSPTKAARQDRLGWEAEVRCKRKNMVMFQKPDIENCPSQAEFTFVAMIENEFLGLHEGNFARFQVLPSEFAAWRDRCYHA